MHSTEEFPEQYWLTFIGGVASANRAPHDHEAVTAMATGAFQHMVSRTSLLSAMEDSRPQSKEICPGFGTPHTSGMGTK